jgi:hypothetical protein
LAEEDGFGARFSKKRLESYLAEHPSFADMHTCLPPSLAQYTARAPILAAVVPVCELSAVPVPSVVAGASTEAHGARGIVLHVPFALPLGANLVALHLELPRLGKKLAWAVRVPVIKVPLEAQTVAEVVDALAVPLPVSEAPSVQCPVGVQEATLPMVLPVCPGTLVNAAVLINLLALPVRHPVAIGGAVIALGLRKWHWKGGYEVGEHLPVRFYRDSTGGG